MNETAYLKQVQRSLLEPAREKARKDEAVRILKNQQVNLVKPAYGGKRTHRKKIKGEYAEKLKKIKLYRTKKRLRRALQTKLLKKPRVKKRLKRKKVRKRKNYYF